MRRSAAERAAFAGVSCVLLGLICLGAGGPSMRKKVPAPEPSPVSVPAPAWDQTPEPILWEAPEVDLPIKGELGFESDLVKAEREQFRVTAEDGTDYLVDAVFPRLALESLDVEYLNEYIGWTRSAFLRPYRDHGAGETWTYAAAQEGSVLTVTLLHYADGAWQAETPWEIDTDTGIVADYQACRDQYRPVDRSGGLVETRYTDFLEGAQSPYSTLALPRILLDSPDAEAVNRWIEEWYTGDLHPGLERWEWEEDSWDEESNVWYEAYRYEDLLSVGIKVENMFGCVHVIAGWTFDSSTGELLEDAAVLERLGASPEQFSQQVRLQVLETLKETLDDVRAGVYEGYGYDEAAAQEVYARECQAARERTYAPEEIPFYLSDTGELHFSLWDSSHRIYGECDCEDWTYEHTLTFSGSAG